MSKALDKYLGLDVAAAEDAAADETAQDSELVAMWQVLGDAKAFLREGNKKHNVKNVLAAAIKAAEKEDPKHPSIAEAKKVLAQFDSADDAAQDAKFKVGQRVKIDRKDATITKTNAEGQWNYYYFKFDGDPRERGIFESEISANSRAQDAKTDFSNRIMPLVRKIADAQKMIEGVLGEAEELEYEAGNGGFPDSTFAKKSATQLGAACYEAVTALRKVKTIAVY